MQKQNLSNKKTTDDNKDILIKKISKIPIGFFLFSIIMILWNMTFLLPAYWAHNEDYELSNSFYYAFSFTCHQIDQRSLCYFPDSNQSMIASCTPYQQHYTATKSAVIHNPVHGVGYKIAVCSRDVAIYGAMLIGCVAWAILNIKNLREQRWPHPIWLLLAMIPIGLDGLTQLIGLRESTNEIRVISGAIIGFACAFYLIPVFNNIFNSLFSDKSD